MVYNQGMGDPSFPAFCGRSQQRTLIIRAQHDFRASAPSTVGHGAIWIQIETHEQRVGEGMSCLGGELSGRHIEIRPHDRIQILFRIRPDTRLH